MSYPIYKHDKVLISFSQLVGKTIKKVVVDNTDCFILTENNYLLDFTATFHPYEDEPMLSMNEYKGEIPCHIAHELGFISQEEKDYLIDKMLEDDINKEIEAKINKLKELINEYPEEAFIYAKSIKDLV